MLSKNLLRVLSLFAALALALAACGGDDDGETGDTGNGAPEGEGDGVLKLGYVLPESGQLQQLGPPQIEAVNYAVSQINDAGGVLGEEIPAVVTGDEAGDKAVAAQSADRVLGQDVDAIIGAAASGMSLAIIDKVTGSGVVQCSGSNTAPDFTDYEDDGFYFRTAPSDLLQGQVLANLVVSDGASNVAILARADDYGRGLANAAEAALQEAGANVALKEEYDFNAPDFNAPVQKVVSAAPDAVILVAFPEDGQKMLKTLLEAGITPDQVPIYGVDGLRSTELPAQLFPDNPGILGGMKGTAPASAENEQFVSGLQEFAPDLTETQFAPEVFDCVITLALAAEVAGSDDPNVFKDEVVGLTKDGEKCSTFADCQQLIADGEDIDYDGVSGPLDFIDAGEIAVGTYEIFGYNAQGELETLDTVQSEPLE